MLRTKFVVRTCFGRARRPESTSSTGAELSPPRALVREFRRNASTSRRPLRLSCRPLSTLRAAVLSASAFSSSGGTSTRPSHRRLTARAAARGTEIDAGACKGSNLPCLSSLVKAAVESMTTASNAARCRLLASFVQCMARLHAAAPVLLRLLPRQTGVPAWVRLRQAHVSSLSECVRLTRFCSGVLRLPLSTAHAV